MDKIIIEDLLVRSIIGINPDERVEKQDILINMVLYTDIHVAGINDDINSSVNYRSVTKRVIQHVETSADGLIEKLVSDIAHLVLSEFAVKKVRVRVEKPGALRFTKSVGIEIERTMQDFA
jgi:FolB domain-containing protein